MLAIWLTLWIGVPARRFSLDIYPRCLDRNVQDLDEGHPFLNCLNMKYARRLQNFTDASRSRKCAKSSLNVENVLSIVRVHYKFYRPMVLFSRRKKVFVPVPFHNPQPSVKKS